MGTSRRSVLKTFGAVGAASLAPKFARAQADAPLQVDIYAATPLTTRIIVSRGPAAAPPNDGPLLHPEPGKPLATLQAKPGIQTVKAGQLRVHATFDPLKLSVEDAHGRPIHSLSLDPATGHFTLPLGTAPVFGLGEGGPQFNKSGSLDRMVSGSGGYQLGSHGSKVPIQWLMSASGALFIHHPLGQFDLRADPGIFIPGPNAQAPLLDVFVVGAPTPAAMLAEYATLTGQPEMPPLWAFGYLQSHRTLGEPAEILEEARTFRAKRLPCDAMIYLGTGFCPNGWNTANGSFDWNPKAFPDPPAAIADLHKENCKVVVHVVLDGRHLTGAATDPCADPTTPLPQRPDRQIGCYWPFHKLLFDLGIDGWWPDEGDGYDAPSRLLRNRMYFEGSQMYRPNRRVFALHRNGYAGMQRYASVLWSGDVQSTWNTLHTQIAVGINAGLSGIPWWGTDIGGFVPTAEYTGELYARWFQFGAFCPLFRSHGRDWRLHLPWGWNTGEIGYPETPSYHPDPAELHNPAIEPICRQYLELRYRLLPYLYAAAREACATGTPMIRAAWLEHPADADAAACDDAYLFGPNLFVAPVYEKGATARTHYLPPGNWYDYWSNERKEGGTRLTKPVDLATMPIYVRTGAVIPMGPVKQYTGEPSSEPLTLRVHPGADGKGTWFEDDGDTFDYHQGKCLEANLTWNDKSRELSIRPTKNSQPPKIPRPINIETAGTQTRQTATYTGKPLTVQVR